MKGWDKNITFVNKDYREVTDMPDDGIKIRKLYRTTVSKIRNGLFALARLDENEGWGKAESRLEPILERPFRSAVDKLPMKLHVPLRDAFNQLKAGYTPLSDSPTISDIIPHLQNIVNQIWNASIEVTKETTPKEIQDLSDSLFRDWRAIDKILEPQEEEDELEDFSTEEIPSTFSIEDIDDFDDDEGMPPLFDSVEEEEEENEWVARKRAKTMMDSIKDDMLAQQTWFEPISKPTLDSPPKINYTNFRVVFERAVKKAVEAGLKQLYLTMAPDRAMLSFTTSLENPSHAHEVILPSWTRYVKWFKRHRGGSYREADCVLSAHTYYLRDFWRSIRENPVYKCFTIDTFINVDKIKIQWE